MEFETFLLEKNYLVKTAIIKLKIAANFDEFYQIGTIALFEALLNYDEVKDYYHNFEIYAYYMILNTMKNELTRQTRHAAFITYIDHNQIDKMDSVYIDDELDQIELDDMIKELPKEQYQIIKLKLCGYKNEEIGEILNLSDDQLKYRIKVAFRSLRKQLIKLNTN